MNQVIKYCKKQEKKMLEKKRIKDANEEIEEQKEKNTYLAKENDSLKNKLKKKDNEISKIKNHYKKKIKKMNRKQKCI